MCILHNQTYGNITIYIYIYNDHSVCALNATESVLYILRIFQVSEELHFSSIVWNTHQVDSNPLQKQNFETSESSEKRTKKAHQGTPGSTRGKIQP